MKEFKKYFDKQVGKINEKVINSTDKKITMKDDGSKTTVFIKDPTGKILISITDDSDKTTMDIWINKKDVQELIDWISVDVI